MNYTNTKLTATLDVEKIDARLKEISEITKSSLVGKIKYLREKISLKKQKKLYEIERFKNRHHTITVQVAEASKHKNRVYCDNYCAVTTNQFTSVFFAFCGPIQRQDICLGETLAENVIRLGLPNIDDHWYSWNTKPIRADVKLYEYLLNPNDCIYIIPRMRGGAQLILPPLYTHVAECERQVLSECYLLQTAFGVDDTPLRECLPDSIQVVYDKFTTLRESLETATNSDVVNLFDNIFQLFYWSRKCENFYDYTVLASLGYTLLTGKSLSSKCFEKLDSAAKANNLQSKFGDFVKTARNLFDMGSSVMANPLVAHIGKIYTFLLVQGFLTKAGQTISEDEYLLLYKKTKIDYKNGSSMAIAMIEGAIMICERIEAYRVTGDWATLVHTQTAYTAWTKEADRLTGLAPFTSNLEPHGTTYFSFVSDLNDTIEKGTALARFTSATNGADAQFLSKKLNGLKMLKSLEITRRAAQEDREAPFGVLIHGDSSVAKSTFTKMMYYYFGKLHGLDTANNYRYVRSPTDEYWSNFDSSKWCIQLDDIAFLLPAKSSEVDPTLKEMLNVVNNVPFVPPQAALEDKGTTPLLAKLVLATTNTPDLSAHEYFNCPLAVRRRLPYVVHIKPKEQYLAPNKKFIDPKKLETIEDGFFPDYWDITVQELEPREFKKRDVAILKDVVKFDSIKGFLKHFGAASREHSVNQNKSLKCDKAMSTAKVCRLCMEIGEDCTCMQSSFITNPIASTLWILFQSYIVTVLANATCGALVWTMTVRYIKEMYRFYTIRYLAVRISNFLDTEKQIRVITIVNGRPATTTVSIKMRTILTAAKWIMSILIIAKVASIVTNKVVAPKTQLKEKSVPIQKEVNGKTIPVVEEDDELLDEWDRGTMEYDMDLLKEQQARIDEHRKRIQAHNARVQKMFINENVFSDGSLPTQGNVFGTDEADLLREETSNVWYTPTLELTTFDLPVASCSLVGKSADFMRDFVAKNCVHLLIESLDETFKSRTCGVYVSAQSLLFNNHSLRTGTRFRVTIISGTQSQGVSPNVSMEFTKEECKINDHKDMVILTTKGLPPRKDITKIWNIKDVPASEMISVRRERSGEVVYRRHYNVSYERNFPVEALRREMNMYMTIASETTQVGDCGSIAIAMTPRGPAILGIHTIGHNNRCGFVHILREDIEDLIKNEVQIVSGEAPKFSLESDVILTPPNEKSVVRWIEKGVVRVYGRLPGFRPKRISRVIETPLCKEMCSFLKCKVAHGKPSMRGWQPWRKNVIEMIQPSLNHKKGVLDTCVKSFTQDILGGLSKAYGDEWKKELMFLSKRSALNGIPGVKFIDAINKSTSMGFPWNKSKKEFLTAKPSEDYPDGVDIDPIVWEKYDTIIDKYHKGERVYPVFSGHLKDEALPFAKCEAHKTRLFTGAPIDWSLVVRSRLLPFIRLLQKNKYIFESGPGTVAQSSEWTEIYSYLTVFGADRIVAGDYSKFDKHMTAPWILGAYEIIINIYKEAGFSGNEIKELWGIAYDTAFPLVNVDNDILEFYGTNPSGHPLTVVINSLVNSLYMRYAYCEIVGEGKCDDFQKHVRLFTYGDDNIMGVSRDVDFSHTKIQSALAKIGVTYTMAEKEAATVPFINIDDTQFLKRKWRFENELGMYTCPLDEESIRKSLTVWVPSQTISPYQQMVDVISSANSEYFFYGKEMFEKHHAFFKQILTLDPYCKFVKENTLPDWDTLKNRFREAYKGESPSLAARELAFPGSETTIVT